ncbi:hypothetical protein EDB85DRAFT_2281273 [Lactarius pseudohatsudake]|nr:hypothetical protein EDB85DRAFT_2281273 [Lactarius pseudohatsudake]
MIDLCIALKPYRENALIDALNEISDPRHPRHVFSTMPPLRMYSHMVHICLRRLRVRVVSRRFSLAHHADDHIAAAHTLPPAAPTKNHGERAPPRLCRHFGHAHHDDQETAGGGEGKWKKDGAKARVPDPKNTAGGP